MIFADNLIQDDPLLRSGAYRYLPTTRMESAGAAFSQFFAENPAIAAGDALLMRARTGFDTDGSDVLDAPAFDRGITGPGMPFERTGNGTNLSQSPLAQEGQIDPVLPMSTANERAAPGLTFDGPIRTSIFEAMNANRLEEIRRDDIINRGPQDAAQFGINFGAGLVASVLDPLNVASAFVPVVGEARAAIFARNLGKIGGRFAKGAIEGAAGALMVEPLAYYGSRGRGLDYDMTDSLLNVAFGTVLGGGLHVAGGALGDVLARADARTREALLRTAVAQIVDGRPIEVRPVLATVPETPLRRRLLGTTTLGQSTGDGLDAALARENLPGMGAPAQERAPAEGVSRETQGERTMLPVLRDDGTPLVLRNRAQADARAEKVSSPQSPARAEKLPDGGYAVVRESAVTRSGDGRDITFRTRRAADRFIARTRRDDAVIQTGPREFTLVRGATPEDVKAIEALPQAVRLAPRSEQPAASTRQRPTVADDRALVEASRSVARENFARRVEEPTQQAIVEAEDLYRQAVAAPVRPADVSSEIDQLTREIDELVDAGALDAEAKAALSDADKLIEDVRRYNKGLRAAAQCMIGRG